LTFVKTRPDAGATLRQATTVMLARLVGALLVTAEGDGRRDALGLVTDRDLVIACVARELAPSEVFVGAIATQPLVSIAATSTASEAAALMHASGVRRLLVIDDHGEVTGLVSSDDLLGALLEPLQMLADALRVNVAREETLRSDTPPPSNRRLFLSLADSPVRV
jgi:signal-transduction protein with cAMP-binding, CBS, and nucleotidyltransferase domain